MFVINFASTLENSMNLFHFRMWDGGADTKQTNFDFGDPAKEVEDIMKRKVSSMASPLARTLQESRLMGSSSPAGPGSIPGARNSPSNAARTLSPSYRHSPKLELELLELGNLIHRPLGLDFTRRSDDDDGNHSAIDHIFSLGKSADVLSLSVFCSFVQIYNEKHFEGSFVE